MRLEDGDVIVMTKWPLPNGGEGEVELIVGAPPKILRVSGDRKSVMMGQVVGGTKENPNVRLWSEPNPEFSGEAP